MRALRTEEAPGAIGPYSQAIESDGLVYCSGQIGLDPATGQLVDGIEAQTRRVMLNLTAVLAAAGLSTGDVVKTTIFLADMEDFTTVNTIYAEYFKAPYPARSTVEVARLPRDARIEIDVVAKRR
ncbi:MAG: RidA family protein [Gemmatimonadota bacterium]|jgi:2-iminobutanoate/2-iminopropanoate deaminase|nr:MAG: RidA family protein [Gemmatimonadota bacterium]